MKKLSLLVMVGLLGVSPVAHGQSKSNSTQGGSDLAWIHSKWTYADGNFRKIRTQLDQIKWESDIPSSKTVANLIETRFPPVAKKIKAQKYGDIKPEDAYWVIALWAYFPSECQKYASWATDMTRHVKAPPSYEYVRAIACMSVRIGDRKALDSVFERLLEKWPLDPLVRWTFVEYASWTNGFLPKVHDRMIKFADELYKEFPKRNEMLCGTGVVAYASYWARSPKQAILDRVIYYLDQGIKNPQVTQARQNRYRALKQYYIDQGKKAGMKVPSG